MARVSDGPSKPFSLDDVSAMPITGGVGQPVIADDRLPLKQLSAILGLVHSAMWERQHAHPVTDTILGLPRLVGCTDCPSLPP
jgi:hypothetical protein